MCESAFAAAAQVIDQTGSTFLYGIGRINVSKITYRAEDRAIRVLQYEKTENETRQESRTKKLRRWTIKQQSSRDTSALSRCALDTQQPRASSSSSCHCERYKFCVIPFVSFIARGGPPFWNLTFVVWTSLLFDRVEVAFDLFVCLGMIYLFTFHLISVSQHRL
jgi:hypothetical protein